MCYELLLVVEGVVTPTVPGGASDLLVLLDYGSTRHMNIQKTEKYDPNCV